MAKKKKTIAQAKADKKRISPAKVIIVSVCIFLGVIMLSLAGGGYLPFCRY